MNSIIIGCDNAAVDFKNSIVDFLKELDIKVEDLGCFSTSDNKYYPYVAKDVCDKIKESNYKKRGILLCGTGIGMCITANKFKGIRAAVCHDGFSAERSILSNDANVICMGARVIGVELAKKNLKEWLSLEYIDGNSTPKILAIKEVEDENLKI